MADQSESRRAWRRFCDARLRVQRGAERTAFSSPSSFQPADRVKVCMPFEPEADITDNPRGCVGRRDGCRLGQLAGDSIACSRQSAGALRGDRVGRVGDAWRPSDPGVSS